MSMVDYRIETRHLPEHPTKPAVLTQQNDTLQYL
jgi:hypothetical protein